MHYLNCFVHLHTTITPPTHLPTHLPTPTQVDARHVIASLSKQWFDCVVAVNQVALVNILVNMSQEKTNRSCTPHATPLNVTQSSHHAQSSARVQLVARITTVHSLDPQQRANTIGYHCYRGVYTPNTHMYVAMQPHGGLGDVGLLVDKVKHQARVVEGGGVGRVCLVHARYVV